MCGTQTCVVHMVGVLGRSPILRPASMAWTLWPYIYPYITKVESIRFTSSHPPVCPFSCIYLFIIHFVQGKTKSSDKWSWKPSKCVETSDYLCHRSFCPFKCKQKSSLFCQFYCWWAQSHWLCACIAELEVSHYTTWSSWNIQKKTLQHRGEKNPKSWCSMYICFLQNNRNSTATTAMELRRGGSKNSVIKIQNDTLRKLKACTSLLQNSVSNTMSVCHRKEEASWCTSFTSGFNFFFIDSHL